MIIKYSTETIVILYAALNPKMLLIHSQYAQITTTIVFYSHCMSYTHPRSTPPVPKNIPPPVPENIPPPFPKNILCITF